MNDKVWQKTAKLVLVLSMKLGECILLGEGEEYKTIVKTLEEPWAEQLKYAEK